MWKIFGALLAATCLCLSACIDSLNSDETQINDEQAFAANDPNPPKEDVADQPASGENSDGGESSAQPTAAATAFSLGSVRWLHTNVSGWPETASLSSVSVGGSSITLNYNKANSWPGVNHAGARVNANPWIFVNQGGTWYGATWEWLRVGQKTKATSSVHGSHIKKSPLTGFSPQSGETYGFMVSGLARDSKRNVKERSNVVMIRWP